MDLLKQFAAKPPDWPALLAPPEAQLPYAYKLEGRLGLASPPNGSLAIDESNLTADFIASTGDVDRTGDIMVVEGVKLENYRLNPVWLLGHAQTFPGGGLAFPIGTSEAPDGTLKVWVEYGKLLARCHFHAATREAVQAFELVKVGVLRGCSIGFNPVTPPVALPLLPGQIRSGYRFDSFELIELSLVGIPMNPYCTLVRRALDLGKLAGEPISAAFRKSLEFMSEPSPVWANGWKGEFRESDHPRDEDGKFGSGGGGGSGDFGESSGESGSGEVIGSGSSGESRKRGDRVYKPAKRQEGKIYSLLAGVEGVAAGRQVGDEIETPFFKNIISVDDISPKERKNYAPVVKKALPRIVNAITALSEAGYSYNDPLQVGFDDKRQAHVFDFSAAEKSSTATRDNLATLSSYLHQFGLERHAEGVSRAGEIKEYVDSPELRDFASEDEETKEAEAVLSRLDGKPATYAYYVFNAREIPGVAQTPHRNGIKVVFSSEPLSDEMMGQWELMPALHRTDTGKAKSGRSRETKDFNPNQSRDADGKFGSGGGSSGSDKKPSAASGSKPAASKPAREASASVVSGVLESTRPKEGAAKRAYRKLKVAVGRKISPKTRNKINKVSRTIAAVEHTLGSFRSASQSMVREVSLERGASDQAAERTHAIASLVDTAAAWTVNVPLAHAGLHAVAVEGMTGFALAKVGYYIPLGSLAYLAYSTARNPLATLRAARNLMSGKSKAKPKKSDEGRANIVRILEIIEAAEAKGQGDWAQAIFMTALESNDYDVEAAASAAIKALADNPEPPDEELDDSEAGELLDELAPGDGGEGDDGEGNLDEEEPKEKSYRKADFREQDHPRAEDGKFGSGGGGGESTQAQGEAKPAAQAPSERRLPKDEAVQKEIAADEARLAASATEFEAKRQAFSQKQETLDRLNSMDDVLPGYSPGIEANFDKAENAVLPGLGHNETPESIQAWQSAASALGNLRAATFVQLADGAINDCAALGLSEKMTGKLRDAVGEAVAAIDRKAARLTTAADKVAKTETDLATARKELEDLEASEPDEPQYPDDESMEAEWEKVHDQWEKDHDKWQSQQDRLGDRIDSAEMKAGGAFEEFEDAATRLGEEYDHQAERFQTVFGKATDELDKSIATESDALDDEESILEGEREDHEEWIQSLLDEEDEVEEPDEPDEDEDEDEDETHDKIARILAPLPGILQSLHAGIKTGTITMKTKAFPPRAKPDNEEDDREEGPEGTEESKPPFRPKAEPAAMPADKPAQPQLAELLANLTSAIVSIQEAIQPKEVPVAAPASSVIAGAEPPVNPAMNGEEEEDEENGKPPATRFDPKRDAEEKDEAREALERYRSGRATRTKGYRRFGKGHMEYLGKVADHLDELAGMDMGTKWSGYHQTACKSHSDSMRKMCKELTESSMSEGGATVNGDTMAEDASPEEVATAVKSALGPFSEVLYRITGKRIA